jgi:hypothetical protein
VGSERVTLGRLGQAKHISERKPHANNNNNNNNNNDNNNNAVTPTTMHMMVLKRGNDNGDAYANVVKLVGRQSTHYVLCILFGSNEFGASNYPVEAAIGPLDTAPAS